MLKERQKLPTQIWIGLRIAMKYPSLDETNLMFSKDGVNKMLLDL